MLVEAPFGGHLRTALPPCRPAAVLCSRPSRPGPGSSGRRRAPPRHGGRGLGCRAAAGKGFAPVRALLAPLGPRGSDCAGAILNVWLEQADEASRKGKGGQEQGEWIPIANSRDFKEGKDTLAVTLKDKSIVTVYRHKGQVFCSDVHSTAYKFPMIDARVFSKGSQVVAEVPLDGTTYSLADGKVLEWCPKNNPLRFLLGTLKSTASPEPLKVWPTRVDPSGVISCRFYGGK